MRLFNIATKPYFIVYAIFSVCIFYPSANFADSLIINGDFEKADPESKAKPLGWEKPDELGVSWINEDGRGKVICMDTSISEVDIVAQWKKQGITDWNIPKPEKNPVAATYGLSYYSVPVKVEPGQAYRITFDYKSSVPGGGGKLWVRGYGMFKGRLRRRYETYIPCRTKNSEWKHISQCLHPTARSRDVTEIRIMLYAYWPPGKYYYDNIILTPVSEEEYLKDKNQNVPVP